MKHRTQILLEPNHYAFLKREALARRCSISSALRSIIEERMQRETRQLSNAEDPFLKIAGRFNSKHSDTSSRDEDILYGDEE